MSTKVIKKRIIWIETLFQGRLGAVRLSKMPFQGQLDAIRLPKMPFQGQLDPSKTSAWSTKRMPNLPKLLQILQNVNTFKRSSSMDIDGSTLVYIYIYIYLYNYPSIHPSIHPSIYLSIDLPLVALIIEVSPLT